MARLNTLTKNQAAFLDMLAFSELGDDLIAASDDGYNVLVGATAQHPLLFNNYDCHPHIFNARFDSTAAGRYQFIFPTWHSLQEKLGLSTFDPAAQDTGCIELLRERNALGDIEAGNIASAIAKCGPIWASLPSSTAGQRTNRLDDLLGAYTDAGGILASK